MKQSVTLTFGERAENHAGMQVLGTEVLDGFNLIDLKSIKNKFKNSGYSCKLINLNSFLDGIEAPHASVLIIRNALDAFGIDAKLLFEEQSDLKKDKKALMRGRVVNKIARYNLCFENEDQKADYENGKGTIVAFKNVPLLEKLKNNLPLWFGEKANNLLCEGNYYYNTAKCGIGYHGDSERKRVVALRLGESNPLVYQWYYKSEKVGRKCELKLYDGDMYVMSEKAVGTDWKRSSIYTLRHAAGCNKYTD